MARKAEETRPTKPRPKRKMAVTSRATAEAAAARTAPARTRKAERMAIFLGDISACRVPSGGVSEALGQAVGKLREDGAGEAVIAAFERRFAQLEEGPDAGF